MYTKEIFNKVFQFQKITQTKLAQSVGLSKKKIY